jgi:hypothetical protein
MGLNTEGGDSLLRTWWVNGQKDPFIIEGVFSFFILFETLHNLKLAFFARFARKK